MTRRAEPVVHTLSKRERQVMDVLYRLKQAPAAVIYQEMSSPPSYSAVRAMLAILERKGHVRHIVDGPRYVYEPVAKRASQRRMALKHIVRTFFDGSAADAMLTLFESTDRRIDEEKLEELARRIAAARKQGI